MRQIAEELVEQLRHDEGVKQLAYPDSRGKWTIGVGHNLQDTPISMAAVNQILADDLASKQAELERYFPWADTLDDVRYFTLLTLVFNMGSGTLLQFHNFLAAMQAKDWPLASVALKASRWYTQVGARAERLVAQVEDGQWHFATP